MNSATLNRHRFTGDLRQPDQLFLARVELIRRDRAALVDPGQGQQRSPGPDRNRRQIVQRTHDLTADAVARDPGPVFEVDKGVGQLQNFSNNQSDTDESEGAVKDGPQPIGPGFDTPQRALDLAGTAPCAAGVNDDFNSLSGQTLPR